jgi:5'-3' exonuclease
MKVIAFDLSGIYWNFAFSGAGKKDVEGPYKATIETLLALSEGFDRRIVAVDAKTNFRKGILETYKSKRPERFAWQFDQLDRSIAWAQNAGFHVFHADGFEADDVIMTSAVWCANQKHHLTIVSDDKDICAALGAGPDITILRHDRKTGNMVHRNAEAFETAYGFKPHRMADFLALAGDTSDDFKFFPYISDETAKKLVMAHESLQDLYDAVCAGEIGVKLDKRQVESLRVDFATVYLRALEIATMRSDVPIDLASLENERPVTLAAESASSPPPNEDPRLEDDLDGPEGAERTNQKISEAPEQLEQASSKSTRVLALRPREGFELVPYELQPHTMKGAHWLAAQAVQSCMFPQFGRTEQALCVILSGRERGLGAMVALENAYVVKGRTGWSAASLAAMVMQSPDCEYFYISFSSKERAEIRTKRRSIPVEQILEYTIDDARQARLLESKPDKSGNETNHWILRPATMLRWAASRDGARAYWPERTTGIFTPAEIRGGYDIADAELETAGEVSAA